MFGIGDFFGSILNVHSCSVLSVNGDSDSLPALIAMLSVIGVAIVCFIIYKVILTQGTKKRTDKNAASTLAGVTENAAEPGEAEDAEIVAVIAAAIAMAESENSGLKFRVVSFKRI